MGDPLGGGAWGIPIVVGPAWPTVARVGDVSANGREASARTAAMASTSLSDGLIASEPTLRDDMDGLGKKAQEGAAKMLRVE